jgi:hypothetical protein
MSTSAISAQPRATSVSFTADAMKVALIDGREVSVPLAWFPRLLDATDAQRASWRLIGGGVGTHWPEIDEDISVEKLLVA